MQGIYQSSFAIEAGGVEALGVWGNWRYRWLKQQQQQHDFHILTTLEEDIRNS